MHANCVQEHILDARVQQLIIRISVINVINNNVELAGITQHFVGKVEQVVYVV